MTGSVQINNFRNIKRLEFKIPDRGVWLLTGGNGAGKTTLLACLRRISHQNAFPVHFPTSLKSKNLDNYSGGTIVYEINGQKVEYAYRGQRWTPQPRRNAELFKTFGYSSVIYVGATADRITPRAEDFDPSRVKQVDKDIVQGVNDIFETSKFDKLRTVNVSRGTGNDAFVLALGTTPQTYHSEKHFSLGELCVLKLLRLLKGVSNNSMIIVDELEMALHPRAQLRLLKHLEGQAADRNLTIIFSTHSVTLLKVADRRRIIFLERDATGVVTPLVGCFPTYAIGNLAANEETMPDVVIYSEDLFARDVLLKAYDQFLSDKSFGLGARPTVKIVPIGGLVEVVKFLNSNKSVLPAYVKQFAILDKDAEDSLVAWRRNGNHELLALFQKYKSQVKFLPFTPEVGLMSAMTELRENFEKELRQRYNDNQIRLVDLISDYDNNLTGAEQRRAAKLHVEKISTTLCTSTNRSPDMVREDICEVFLKLKWHDLKPDFMSMFGSVVS